MIDVIKNHLRERLGIREGSEIKLIVVNGGVSVRSKLVCLCWVGNSPDPAYIVKFPRYPMYKYRVQFEYEGLQELQPYLPPGSHYTSRPILATSIDGLFVTVETATRGRMLRAHLREYPGAYIEELEQLKPFITWLGELHLRSSRIAGSQEMEKWILEPLRSAPAELGLSDLEYASLKSLGEEAVEILRRQALPLVFNHNDPGTTNVLVDKAGRFTGLIDWESGAYGLPLTDLFYFLGRYAFETRDLGRGERLRGYREMFFRSREPEMGAFKSNLARTWIAEYCGRLGNAREWIPVLFMLCWVMHARNEKNHLTGLLSEGQMIVGKPADTTQAVEGEEIVKKGHFRSLLRFYLENLGELDVGMGLSQAER